MTEQKDFLVELGTEELPPTSLSTFSKAFTASIETQLQDLGLTFTALKPYASPRRLALVVENLASNTPKKDEVLWGPPAKAAYDADGQPTKALLGFAKKNNVDPASVTVANDGKVDKVQIAIQTGGEQTAALLPGMIEQALASLPIPKRMRWGASRNEFVRPVHWLVMLFGQDVLPCSILGLTAGKQTWGHRIHANRAFELADAQQYARVLESEGKVMADFEARKALIEKQVQQLGDSLGGVAVIDPDLLDEVTALVEWPVAMAGGFEERFLSVPSEALISSMKEHQKYFHVEDQDGNLKPNFITVCNIESKDPSQVVAGNEKVIRPRLSDAAFFFETDKKTRLDEHRNKLKTVVFQAKLGTVYDKTERIAQLAVWLAEKVGGDVGKVQRAGQLSKADLATSMVYEFADMQGIAGQYYASIQGEDSEVAAALKEQYLPKFSGDVLPATQTGALVALADRIDTLTGIFGIGQSPTGSKDPFALRRASLAALRLMVEKQFDLDLKAVLLHAYGLHAGLAQDQAEKIVDAVLNYMLDRFRSWYEDAGVPISVYQAVAAKQLTSPLDINNRVYAVQAFNELREAQALAAANKRVSNILNKLDAAPTASVDEALLSEAAEQALASQLQQAEAEASPLFQQREYTSGLQALAQLQQTIDAFFDDVTVMAEDSALKNNRLALLQKIRNLFLHVADISLLVTTK